jgi:hypothetical protein
MGRGTPSYLMIACAGEWAERVRVNADIWRGCARCPDSREFASCGRRTGVWPYDALGDWTPNSTLMRRFGNSARCRGRNRATRNSRGCERTRCAQASLQNAPLALAITGRLQYTESNWGQFRRKTLWLTAIRGNAAALRVRRLEASIGASGKHPRRHRAISQSGQVRPPIFLEELIDEDLDHPLS